MRAGIGVVLVAVLASGCGGGTEPSEDGSVAGLWNATIDRTAQFPGGGVGHCTVAWAMAIEDVGPPGDPNLFTTFPFTARSTCDNGFGGPWEFRGFNVIILQDGSTVVFLSAARADTFLVATMSGSTLRGTIGQTFYSSATFVASRRSGADPNLQPGLLDVFEPIPIEIGDTVRVGAQVADGYGRTLDTVRVEWTSSDPEVATIDPDGLVTGLRPGETTIVGVVPGVRDSVTLTVLPPAASVEITQAPDSLIVPQGFGIAAVARDAAGQELFGRRFTWSTSDPTVASVDSEGLVSAVSPGTVTITVRSTVVSDAVTFTVLPGVAEIQLASTGTAVALGGTLQITATTRDADGNLLTGRPVQWSAGDGTIISVDANGLTRGVSAGTIQLTASSELTVETLELSAVMDGPLAAVAAGHAHTCGMTTAGSAYCWGQNVVGQLGPSPEVSFGRATPVLNTEDFESIVSRGSHTCALDSSGDAFCWGLNTFGQLGVAGGSFGEVESVSGGLTFSQLAAGFEYTCGLVSGSAYCWGLNSAGQLGRDADDVPSDHAPAAVLGGHTFTSIAAGEQTACGLTAGGQAWCWGSNQFGNLGLGTQDTDSHPTPVHAAPALTFSIIAPGLRRTCGLTTGGVVQCWGEGQLTPAPFDATDGYTELVAGQSNFCQVDGSGTVSCWGDLDFGAGPDGAVEDVAVGSSHACARLVGSGKLVCWGSNDEGQLGDGFGGPGPVEPLGQP